MSGRKALDYSLEAPAKINLHLEILDRRADGYHELRSLFLMVGLCDRLQVSIGGDTDRLTVSGTGEVDPADNTVIRALALFRRETGFDRPVSVTLEKRIPTGSGLGGGSSDAAALLRLLNRNAPRTLLPRELHELGAEIGSDVPFFLGAPCAVVEGRGEIIHSCPGPSRGVTILLAVPDWSVSTAAAYRWLDEQPAAPDPRGPSAASLARAVNQLSPRQWNFFNSFLEVVAARHPRYRQLIDHMDGGGALWHGLSGSGSAYFGVFEKVDAAVKCLHTLRGNFRFQGIVSPLETVPAVG